MTYNELKAMLDKLTPAELASPIDVYNIHSNETCDPKDLIFYVKDTRLSDLFQTRGEKTTA